jgi:hypothetical protein
MLRIYRQAIATTQLPDVGGGKDPIVVAFGSFGRLDGAPDISDYDVLFMYPGSPDRTIVESLRASIRDIVSGNRALPFDHREEIESGVFDFDHSPAYPVLSTEELRSAEHEIRALQLITEGRAITNGNQVRSLRSDLLRYFGLADNIYELNLAPFRKALDRMKVSYCTGIFGRLKAEHRPLSNRKILKLFALREFCHLTTLLAAAEVAIAVSGANLDADAPRIAQILSSPSILKVASFGDPSASLGNLITGVSPEVYRELLAIARSHRERLQSSSGTRYDETVDGNDGEADLFEQLKGLTLPVLREYDALIQLLHEPKFLGLIEPLEPDLTTWLGYAQFQKVLDHRASLISLTKRLASSLHEILNTVQLATRAPTLDDAKESLTWIMQYTLDLGRTLPRAL